MGTPIARLAVLVVLGFVGVGCAKTPPTAEGEGKAVDYTARAVKGRTIGSIDRLDPGLDAIIPADAQIEVLVENLDWCEGPVWIKAGPVSKKAGLLFGDIPQNTVYRLDPVANTVEVFLKPSGYTSLAPRGGEVGSNGLTVDPTGRLVLCQHGDRRVARLEGAEPKRTFISLAEGYEEKRFNSPNDLVYDRAGNLFFTDPPYGLEKNMADPKKELDFQGVYRLSADGKLTLVTKELTRPNGIALSPDEKTLYVAVSDPKDTKVWAFDLQSDGTVKNKRVFFDATALSANPANKGLPDGLKVDVKGNVFCGGPGGILVLTPAGKHLGTIRTGEKTSNCAWGDDGATLYMTADMYVCRIRTATRGAGW